MYDGRDILTKIIKNKTFSDEGLILIYFSIYKILVFTIVMIELIYCTQWRLQ
jgi:hypothetical protein